MSEQKTQFGAEFEAEVAKAQVAIKEHVKKSAEVKKEKTSEVSPSSQEIVEQSPTEKLWSAVGDEKRVIGDQKKLKENSIRSAQNRPLRGQKGEDLTVAGERHAKEMGLEIQKFEADLIALGYREKVLETGLQAVAEGKNPDAAFRDQLKEIKKRLVREAVSAQNSYEDLKARYGKTVLESANPIVNEQQKDVEAKKKKVQNFLSAVEGLGIVVE